jgi:phosphatidylglycerol:prolipoprotein diacylglycerol transferase
MPPDRSPYTLLLVFGIVASLFVWIRVARRDRRLIGVYIGALLGAFTGAKLVYLASEGWLFWNSPDRWIIWATGKTILGALLGGYAAVEIVKKVIGYQRPTGDLFAIVAPLGIIFGRIGCLLHGCCLGRVCEPHWWALRDAHGMARWPAVPAEIAMNAVSLATLASMRAARLLPGQLFHLYLIAYGIFRFLHELFRETPRVALGLTGYQFAALACIALGSWRFLQRRRDSTTPQAAPFVPSELPAP